MYTNGHVEFLRLLTELVRFPGILNGASSDEKMVASYTAGPLDDLVHIGWMYILGVILTWVKAEAPKNYSEVMLAAMS